MSRRCYNENVANFTTGKADTGVVGERPATLVPRVNFCNEDGVELRARAGVMTAKDTNEVVQNKVSRNLDCKRIHRE